jgi:hypothetical protein
VARGSRCPLSAAWLADPAAHLAGFTTDTWTRWGLVGWLLAATSVGLVSADAQAESLYKNARPMASHVEGHPVYVTGKLVAADLGSAGPDQGTRRCARRTYATMSAEAKLYDERDIRWRIELRDVVRPAEDQKITATFQYSRAEWSLLDDPQTAVLGDLAARCPRPLVVLVDEADGLVGAAMVSFLTQLRQGYIGRQETPFPYSVVLIGLRRVRDDVLTQEERRAVTWLGTSSPFNIGAEVATLAPFSAADVAALLAQHTAATGQRFPRHQRYSLFKTRPSAPTPSCAGAIEVNRAPATHPTGTSAAGTSAAISTSPATREAGRPLSGCFTSTTGTILRASVGPRAAQKRSRSASTAAAIASAPGASSRSCAA